MKSEGPSICLFLLLLLDTSGCHGDLPLVKVEGTHYEVGFQLGATLKEKILEQVTANGYLNYHFIPFYQSEEGKSVYKQFLNTAQKYFPQYVDEIRGLSQGSGVNFDKLMLVHLESELSIYKSVNPYQLGGCSDFLLKKEEQVQHIHSEDVPVADSGGVLVEVNITPAADSPYRAESFTAYAYPGTLPGNGFGFNSHGLTVGGNLIFQQPVNLHGIPRRFINRAILTASTIKEAEEIAKTGPGIASSFSYNLGQRICECPVKECVQLANIELSGHPEGATVDRYDITGFYYHFNQFQRVEVPVMTDLSSRYREERLFEILGVNSHEKVDLNHVNLLQIMSDTKDPDYPVYRDGQPPDYLKTSALALFDYNRDEMLVFTDKPKNSSPVHIFSMKKTLFLGSPSSTKSTSSDSINTEL